MSAEPMHLGIGVDQLVIPMFLAAFDDLEPFLVAWQTVVLSKRFDNIDRVALPQHAAVIPLCGPLVGILQTSFQMSPNVQHVSRISCLF